MGQSAEELRHDIESTRSDLGETLQAIGDRVSPARMMERRKNRVLYSIHNVRDRVMGTASDTGRAITDTGRAITDTASGAVDTLTGTPDALRHQAQGSPLVAGAIAFGVGVLAASLAKPSGVERQAADQLMAKAEPLKDELKHTGQEMAEHLKQPAQEAVSAVKEAASEGTQAVSQSASDVVASSKDAAKDAAGTIRAGAAENSADRLP
jgi:gas vesicle protein